MAPSRRTLYIALALLISVSFVATGYFLSSKFETLTAGAASTEELLRAYAEKDTDADGLPDWQEELYETDPTNPRSVDPNLTDREAVDTGKVQPKFNSEGPPPGNPITDEDFSVDAPDAGSLTEEFSRSFLERYLSSGGGEVLDQAAQQGIVEDLIAEFSEKTAEQFRSEYGTLSVVRAPLGDALSYATALENVLINNPVEEDTADPMPLIEAYVEQGDESAREKLLVLAGVYAGIAEDLATTPAPEAFMGEHLALLRSFDLLAQATHALATTYERDPVTAFGALSIYVPAWESVGGALITIAGAVLQSGEPAPGAPGALLVEMARSVDTP